MEEGKKWMSINRKLLKSEIKGSKIWPKKWQKGEIQ